MYDNLETPEGQRNIHRIAKARNRATKDLTHIKQIKDKNGGILTREDDIKIRWKEYFGNLLNEENPRSVRGDGVPVERQVPRISRREVRRALGKMKKGKAVRPDGIPLRFGGVWGKKEWKFCGTYLLKSTSKRRLWLFVHLIKA